MITYNDCVNMSLKGFRRKLCNNTYLERIDDETFGVLYHRTYVVKIHKDGTYTLNNGGWETSTTKERMNAYSPVSIYQKNFIWYVGNSNLYEKTIFVNGMRFDKNGKLIKNEQTIGVV